MRDPILPVFDKFPAEAIFLASLLAGYGDLEVSALNCVAMTGAGLDAALKKMFRERGETKRIGKAEALGQAAYKRLRLSKHFAYALRELAFCLSIRNQYAHCQWYDDNTGNLAFVNLEEIATSNATIFDLKALTTHHVDDVVLQQQEAYFVYVRRWFDYLNWEGQLRAGKVHSHAFSEPQKVVRPPLHSP
jgi:hypothetical protein